MGWGGGYDQLCCPASPKLLLGLDLGLGFDNSTFYCCLNVDKTVRILKILKGQRRQVDCVREV